jgi:hypothetical protein
MQPYSRVIRNTAILVVLAGSGLPARGDVITDWNETAIQVTATPPNALLQARVLATAHLAMLEALNAVGGVAKSYAVKVKAPKGASPEAAVAAAAHGVLARMTRGQQESLDAALAASLAGVPAGQTKTDGISVGTEVAEKLVALRRSDGADARTSFTPSKGAGRWQPTPPQNAPAVLPHWGAVKPFVLESATQFAVKGPPPIGSDTYVRDLAEVKKLGGRRSTVRTADQTAAAIFWTIQTLVPWNAAGRAAAKARGNTLEENARLFAALNAACSDAHVAGFEIKYRLQHWRPVTAIRAAAEPGSADEGWEPLLATPAHPEYPSTHAACSGAAEAVLKGFFGRDEVAVSVVHPPVFGVTRTYASFSQIAQEVDDARVWGGIHFRTADVDGRYLGRRIGEYVLKALSAPPVVSN